MNYKGHEAIQQIAEKMIRITRDARPKWKEKDGKRLSSSRIKGEPLFVRLVVSRIVDRDGKELAMWYLLAKDLENVPAATIALWYYWRWSIESYYKLMKSAGMQLESWQQTTGEAIARRILVAGMACVCVWRIAHAKGAEAGELRKILIKLSGRQMKRGKPFTISALLSGFWSLLSLQELLTNYSVDHIQSLISNVFGEEFV